MRFIALSIVVTACMLTSCANIDVKTVKPISDKYCDSYFNYPMCVKDVTGDGEIDFMYFSDTKEIFMLATDIDAPKSEFPLHECVQAMDKDMRNVGSQLLHIDENTPTLQKTQLKTRLIFEYTRYIKNINSCHKPEEYATPEIDSDFGEEDFEEL